MPTFINTISVDLNLFSPSLLQLVTISRRCLGRMTTLLSYQLKKDGTILKLSSSRSSFSILECTRYTGERQNLMELQHPYKENTEEIL